MLTHLWLNQSLLLGVNTFFLTMKLTLTWYSLLAFVALLFFMMEAHELVHTSLGRLLCGGWGKRDFNVWSLCDACAIGRPWNLAATFAGPVFTFAMGWWGYFLLDPRNSVPRQSLGFVLVFANMPFGRLLGAFTGGNDEVYALSKLFPIMWPGSWEPYLCRSLRCHPCSALTPPYKPKRGFGFFSGFSCCRSLL